MVSYSQCNCLTGHHCVPEIIWSVISWYLYHLSFQKSMRVLNFFLCVYYMTTGSWNHMVIASVKVFLLFLLVDIISNCQTIIIDNYTKNRGNFFEWNEYNFDDIDKLMLKKKADDEFKIIVLKQRIFSKMVRALHSCTTTVWALRSVQCHGKAISTRLLHCLRVDFKIREKASLFVWKYVCNEYKKKFSNHYKIMLLLKNAK